MNEQNFIIKFNYTIGDSYFTSLEINAMSTGQAISKAYAILAFEMNFPEEVINNIYVSEIEIW